MEEEEKVAPTKKVPRRKLEAKALKGAIEEEEKIPPKTFGPVEDDVVLLDKEYHRFDYFYQRTCFRLVCEFYKKLFDPCFTTWKIEKNQKKLNGVFTQFAQTSFPKTMEKLSNGGKRNFVRSLEALIFSHRHKKQDSVLASTADFNQVRDPMYKYSKNAEQAFLTSPYLAYMLKWFSSSAQGSAFVTEKFGTKGVEYCQRMREELKRLEVKAEEAMRKKADGRLLLLVVE